MIAPDCAAARERAPDLALGMLDGAERAAVLEHTHRCPSCQALLSDLSGVADTLVHLAPELEPPAGLASRLVAMMRQPRRSRRRVVSLVAAAVAAAAIGSVVAVRMIDANRDPASAVAPTLERTPMVGVNGVPVGDVVTASGASTAVTVKVDYAVSDGRYDIVLRSPDSSTVLGSMEIQDGRGEWSGRLDGSHDTASVDLVDTGGASVCSAEIGDV